MCVVYIQRVAGNRTKGTVLLRDRILGDVLVGISLLIVLSTVASLADTMPDMFLAGFIPLTASVAIAVFLLKKDSTPQTGVIFVTAALLNSTVHMWGGATGPAAFLYPLLFLWMKRDSIGGPVLTIAGVLGAVEFISPVVAAAGLKTGSFDISGSVGVLGGAFVAGIIPLVSMLAVEYLKTDRPYAHESDDTAPAGEALFPDDVARSLIPILKAGTGAHGIYLFVGERKEVWTLNEFVADSGEVSVRYMVGPDDPVVQLINNSSQSVIHTTAGKLSVEAGSGLPWYITRVDVPWVSVVKFSRQGKLSGFMVLDFDSEESRKHSSPVLVDSVFLLSISWEMAREERDNGFLAVCEEMEASRDVKGAVHKLIGHIVSSLPGTTATVAIVNSRDTLVIYESRGSLSEGRAGRERSIREGVAGMAISRGQPIRRLKMGSVNTFGKSDNPGSNAGSCCAVPLENSGTVIGVLTVESVHEQQFSSDDLAVFKAYATVFSLAANRNQLQQSVQRLKKIDRLTGLPLLSTFRRYLADLIRGVRSRAVSVAVLAVDICDFSGINRELGYDAGDIILGEAAGKMQSVLGDKAILARYGPDSFLICLSGVDRVSAEAYAARIHEEFALNPIEVSRRKITIQVCIGGAVSHVDKMILKLPGIAVKAVEVNSFRSGVTAVKEVGQFYDAEQ